MCAFNLARVRLLRSTHVELQELTSCRSSSSGQKSATMPATTCGTASNSAFTKRLATSSRKQEIVSARLARFCSLADLITDYNVIMDFVFAAFPWVITYSLDMKRKEKVALCLTMSLVLQPFLIERTNDCLIRTGHGHCNHDRYSHGVEVQREWQRQMFVQRLHYFFQRTADLFAGYFWRNAMSNIWYSSEITGTIIVQCIPILRPLVQEIHTSLRSKRLGSKVDDVALEQAEPPQRHTI